MSKRRKNLLDDVPCDRYVRMRPNSDGTYHIEAVGRTLDDVRAGTDTELWYKALDGRMERCWLAYKLREDGSQYDVWMQPKRLHDHHAV